MASPSEFISESDIYGRTDNTLGRFRRHSSVSYGVFNSVSDVPSSDPLMESNPAVSVPFIFSGFMERFAGRCC